MNKVHAQDLLPLPRHTIRHDGSDAGASKCASARRTLAKGSASRLSAGVGSLNELAGYAADVADKVPSNEQELCLKALYAQCKAYPKPASGALLSPHAALQEVLHCPPGYTVEVGLGERSDLTSYQESQLSVPSSNVGCVQLIKGLPEIDAKLLAGEGEGLLLSPDGFEERVRVDGGKIKPYMCPSLNKVLFTLHS